MTTKLRERYETVRAKTLALCDPLLPEDFVIQSMTDTSPPKWHLAHTTWFFETFVLEHALSDYRPTHPQYRVLFNSYYETVGAMHPRPERGILSRPTIDQIRGYRRTIDERVMELVGSEPSDELVTRIELGLHHEEQHQELIVMDVKHNLFCNPLFPAYREDLDLSSGDTPAQSWTEVAGGQVEIGSDGSGFCYDNEGPRHAVLLRDFSLANRLVNNGEWRAFIEDGGYTRPELWLSDGWKDVCARNWQAPLYWVRVEGQWHQFTLAGLRPVVDSEPVVHVSYLEADAFARWSKARLPTEAEWETVAATLPVEGNLAESGRLHPAPPEDSSLAQMFGDVWEWTQSSYSPYPGYQAVEGALGEYNGKWMCNQQVLRGGSCATPQAHVRATYRNFYYPNQRWNHNGVRLAR